MVARSGLSTMLLLKSDVIPHGIRGEILLAIMVAEGIWRRYDLDLMITSLYDGTHMTGSLHYKGLAVDLRTKGTNLSDRLFKDVRAALPVSLYDVLLESLGQD